MTPPSSARCPIMGGEKGFCHPGGTEDLLLVSREGTTFRPDTGRTRREREKAVSVPQVRPLPGLVWPEDLVQRPKVTQSLRQAGYSAFLVGSDRGPDQVRTANIFPLSGMGRETRPGAGSCPEGARLKPNDLCCPPRVSGYGYQARAALVGALVEDGCLEVAGEVAHCSSFILGAGRGMTLHENEEGRRHLGGMNHCGRACCPICGPYLMAKRMEALHPVAERLAEDEGLRFFYLVMTIRHKKGGRFRELVRILRLCQRNLVQNRAKWRKVIEGHIRVLESTHTRNGHHPHENMILAADAGIDADAFFAWLQKQFEKTARKHKRTAEWAEVGQDGTPHPWWSEIPRDELGKVVNYLGSDEKMGRPPAALREALGSAHKHQPLWAMEPRAFAEVWTESKGLRWFDVGGVFRTVATDKTDEELNEERVETAPAIGYVPRDVFRTWTGAEKRDRQAVLVDRTLMKAQALEYLVAVGGVVGPPPEPDWGVSEARPAESDDPPDGDFDERDLE